MGETGYIKLHRKILDNPIVCKDSEYFSVWVYLLLNATHKETPAIFKGEKILLKPGQLITGRLSISEKLKISESKVKRILVELENDQQIDRQRSNKNSLISILKWEYYQKTDQQNNQQMTNNRPATDQQLTTNKNDNNIYLFLFNKYKRVNRKNFGEYVKNVKALREDSQFELLSEEEQQRLISQI